MKYIRVADAYEHWIRLDCVTDFEVEEVESIPENYWTVRAYTMDIHHSTFDDYGSFALPERFDTEDKAVMYLRSLMTKINKEN